MNHTLQMLVDIHKFIDKGSYNTEEINKLYNDSEFAFRFNNIDCYYMNGVKGNMTIRILWTTPLVGVILLNPTYKKSILENIELFLKVHAFELGHELGHMLDPRLVNFLSNIDTKKDGEKQIDYLMRSYDIDSEIYADTISVRLYGVESGIHFLTKSIQCHERYLIQNINTKLSKFHIDTLGKRLKNLLQLKDSGVL